MSKLGGGSVFGGAISGTVKVSGLSIDLRTTTQDIGDTAVLLPAIALSQRNSLSIQNLSTVDTLYVGDNSSVTANRVIGTTAGLEVGPNESYNIDITDAILLYGIAETGKTIRVKITEVA